MEITALIRTDLTHGTAVDKFLIKINEALILKDDLKIVSWLNTLVFTKMAKCWLSFLLIIDHL